MLVDDDATTAGGADQLKEFFNYYKKQLLALQSKGKTWSALQVDGTSHSHSMNTLATYVDRKKLNLYFILFVRKIVKLFWDFLENFMDFNYKDLVVCHSCFVKKQGYLFFKSGSFYSQTVT